MQPMNVRYFNRVALIALVGIVIGGPAALEAASSLAKARPSPRYAVGRESTLVHAQQDQDRKRKDTKVGMGQRVKAGDLPRTGPRAIHWIVIGAFALVLGSLLVAGMRPGSHSSLLAAPLWRLLVNAAACGYPRDAGLYDLERQSRPR